MSSRRWDRLDELFHATLARSAGEREAFLAHECAGDAALRREVARLLAAHEHSAEFIEQPAIANAGALLLNELEPSVVGRRFGSYKIVREIARGGMGAVHLAERDDGRFEQRVAIKIIKRGMDTELLRRRFHAERQILASFDHPNIARLLDGGTTDDGRPYFIMEYIDGRPIDDYASSQSLGVPERLRLFVQTCGALAYAHANSVIHRDIKPANILVTPAGVVKLLDFGVAKLLDQEPGAPRLSVAGMPLLTPKYASPEQVAGKTATVESDVYSLGVVLYELLTGHSPYPVRSRDPLDFIEAVITTDPERPSTVVTQRRDVSAEAGAGIGPQHRAIVDDAEHRARELRGDLDRIVLMALEKEPERRYRSVRELSDEIERHLGGTAGD